MTFYSGCVHGTVRRCWCGYDPQLLYWIYYGNDIKQVPTTRTMCYIYCTTELATIKSNTDFLLQVSSTLLRIFRWAYKCFPTMALSMRPTIWIWSAHMCSSLIIHAITHKGLSRFPFIFCFGWALFCWAVLQLSVLSPIYYIFLHVTTRPLNVFATLSLSDISLFRWSWVSTTGVDKYYNNNGEKSASSVNTNKYTVLRQHACTNVNKHYTQGQHYKDNSHYYYKEDTTQYNIITLVTRMLILYKIHKDSACNHAATSRAQQISAGIWMPISTAQETSASIHMCATF
jgi:hypothetical protein